MKVEEEPKRKKVGRGGGDGGETKNTTEQTDEISDRFSCSILVSY